jgi:hypothetical protein
MSPNPNLSKSIISKDKTPRTSLYPSNMFQMSQQKESSRNNNATTFQIHSCKDSEEQAQTILSAIVLRRDRRDSVASPGSAARKADGGGRRRRGSTLPWRCEAKPVHRRGRRRGEDAAFVFFRSMRRREEAGRLEGSGRSRRRRLDRCTGSISVPVSGPRSTACRGEHLLLRLGFFLLGFSC